MHVSVDYERCEGHGQCVMTSAAVFFLGDDDDQVTVTEPNPSDDQRAAVERAVGICPVAAITLAG